MPTENAETEIVEIASPVVMPPTATVMQAARNMRSQHSSAALVIEDGRLTGIFTGRDAVDRVLAEGRDPTTTLLGDVMSYNPVTLARGQTAAEAIELMRRTHCRHLPVLADGMIVGLMSRGDLREAR